MARRYWWANAVFLALCDRLFLSLAPLSEVRREGFCRAKCRIDCRTTHHRWQIWGEIGKWHDRRGMLCCCMRESFQGGEGLHAGKFQYSLMRLNYIEIKANDPVVQLLCLLKQRNLLRLVGEHLFDRFRGFGRH